MLMTPELETYAKQEITLHDMCSNHDNVVKLYDSNEDEKQYKLYMEYCDRPDYLSDKILEVKKISEY